jgi:uncharacterized protein (DUF1330 family)
MAIRPHHTQIEQLVADSQRLTGEVVMLNLLKYKASSSDGQGSGADAYQRYADQAVKMVERQGGTIVWMGKPEQVLIGDGEADAWDAVALVRYPSRQAFMEMTAKPEYEQAHTHREAGLERTVLLPMTPAPGFAAADGGGA